MSPKISGSPSVPSGGFFKPSGFLRRLLRGAAASHCSLRPSRRISPQQHRLRSCVVRPFVDEERRRVRSPELLRRAGDMCEPHHSRRERDRIPIAGRTGTGTRFVDAIGPRQCGVASARVPLGTGRAACRKIRGAAVWRAAAWRISLKLLEAYPLTGVQRRRFDAVSGPISRSLGQRHSRSANRREKRRVSVVDDAAASREQGAGDLSVWIRFDFETLGMTRRLPPGIQWRRALGLDSPR